MSFFCRFVFQDGYSTDAQKLIEEEIDFYLSTSSQKEDPFIQPDLDLPLSMREQYVVLSHISNYHWQYFLGCDKNIVRISQRNSRFQCFRSFTQTKGVTPKSLRNRLIYFSQDLTNDRNMLYVYNMLAYAYDGVQPTPLTETNIDDDETVLHIKDDDDT